MIKLKNKNYFFKIIFFEKRQKDKDKLDNLDTDSISMQKKLIHKSLATPYQPKRSGHVYELTMRLRISILGACVLNPLHL